MREVETLGGAARARVRIPDDWTERPGSLVLADVSGEAIAGVQLTLVALAASDADIVGFARWIDATFARQVQGGFRLEIVDDGLLPDGRYRVGRVVPQRLYAIGVRGRVGAPAISAHGWAPLDREHDLGALVVEACKTFESF